eukprot:TRINITY_DN5997_c0_g1_i1.p1 TRINITY_DN5997_c0_g1~~TRINITY_DN5997_c0_g1_i1.p1  ORF type:complete len:219 (+),score=48.48 TRINITY_DN5997_c0_g1_i1:95-658(+)
MSAPPPEYQQDLQRHQQGGTSSSPRKNMISGEQVDLTGCRPNFEKTISDCQNLVQLAEVAHSTEGGELIQDKASVRQSKEQLYDVLCQQIGRDKLKLCVDLYSSFDTEGDDTELLHKLQGVLGPQVCWACLGGLCHIFLDNAFFYRHILGFFWPYGGIAYDGEDCSGGPLIGWVFIRMNVTGLSSPV